MQVYPNPRKRFEPPRWLGLAMVAVGAVPADLDWKASYTLQFVNKGVGLDLKPAE